jgi:RimK family alpha-L-glutamate ligase
MDKYCITGWLSVNAFVNTPKFDEIYAMLFSAAEKCGIKLLKKTNASVLSDILKPSFDEEIKKIDFVLFWDKDIRLAKMLEKKGLRLFNCAEAIECCDDKSLTYIKLADTDIAQPKTYISPKTFLKTGYEDYSFIPDDFKYPVIVKEAFGSFGKQVFMAKDRDNLIETISTLENRPFIIQELIESSIGKDVRINVVGDKAVAAMLRYNENDFRANITNGGKMKRYKPTSMQEELAVTAARALGLDFGGIDILFGENGPVFCEANSNAHFKNIYDCTGVNVAEHIMEHIKHSIKDKDL